jgi:hypothetical protein
MRGRREERIEAAVDHVAAAMLGGAAAFLLFQLFRDRLPWLQLGTGTVIVFAIAYVVTSRLLALVQPRRPQFDFPVFRMADLDVTESDELLLTEQVELVLTDADRLRPQRTAEEELVLNDILAKLGPDSRVVRLFDPASVPTPGQLQTRIDDYLHGEAPSSPAPDASKALYDALAELRRSLR